MYNLQTNGKYMQTDPQGKCQRQQAGREFIKTLKTCVREMIQLYSSTVNQGRVLSEIGGWEHCALIFMNHSFVVAELVDRQEFSVGPWS